MTESNSLLVHGKPTVYNRAPYVNASAAADRGLAVYYNSDLLMVPFVMRQIPGSTSVDATSPYGYPAMLKDQADLGRVHDGLERMIAWMRDRELVSAFLRLSPFEPPELRAALDEIGCRTWTTGTIVVANLENEDAYWQAASGRHRTAVRKTTQMGLEVTVDRATADDLGSEGVFRQIYSSTMQRVSATDYFFFGDSYFEQLSALTDDVLVATVFHEGSPVASALFLLDGDTAHYHLSGSTDLGRGLGATNALIDAASRQLIAQHGVLRLNLGGGLSRDPRDPLYRFKRSIGGEVHDFFVGGLIIDEDQYRALYTGIAPIDEVTFFPAYRAGGS